MVQATSQFTDREYGLEVRRILFALEKEIKDDSSSFQEFKSALNEARIDASQIDIVFPNATPSEFIKKLADSLYAICDDEIIERCADLIYDAVVKVQTIFEMRIPATANMPDIAVIAEESAETSTRELPHAA